MCFPGRPATLTGRVPANLAVHRPFWQRTGTDQRSHANFAASRTIWFLDCTLVRMPTWQYPAIMTGKRNRKVTAENAKEKPAEMADTPAIPATTAEQFPMAVNQAADRLGIKPLPIEEPGRSYLSILTEGDDDDLEQLPKLPKKVGRPGRPLDHQLLADDTRGWEILEGLLRIQCTIEECAAVFGRSGQWLRERVQDIHGCTFMEYADKIRPLGMISLRRKQMQLAMSGDRQMLIHLGKQHLSQSDKTETRNVDANGVPIPPPQQLDPADVVLQGLATIAQRQQLAQQARAQLASTNAEGPQAQIESGKYQAPIKTVPAPTSTDNEHG